MEYDVPYSAAAQRRTVAPDGTARAGTATWDASRLLGVWFAVDPVQTFDVWIDDVRFYSCGATECRPTCADPALPVACPATSASPASCPARGNNASRTLSAALPGVWGTGPDDVWAVGYGGTILHWDGSAWFLVPSDPTEWLSLPWEATGRRLGRRDRGHHPALGWRGLVCFRRGTAESLYGLWGSGPNDVWTVGNAGTIRHWDGAAWSAVASGTSYSLWRVWGSAPNDVWAAGYSTSTLAGVIVHWDGATWSPVSGAAPMKAVGVSGTGPNDVWVVGYDGAIVHWNGSPVDPRPERNRSGAHRRVGQHPDGRLGRRHGRSDRPLEWVRLVARPGGHIRKHLPDLGQWTE